jgi:hypothetical protein
MDTIQNRDNSYEDDSTLGSPARPRFTRGAVRTAHQVVALRPAILRPVQRLWSSLGTGTYRAQLVAGIALFAIAGGVTGGLLATAGNNRERAIYGESVTAGADASTQSDISEPVSGSMVEPAANRAKSGPLTEFEGPEVERAVAELRRRRPATKAKKAYRVAIIYPDDDDNFEYRRKRGRKH